MRRTNAHLPTLIGAALAPVPLFVIQPILTKLVREVARRRPDLFSRLGPHTATTFAINADELPFILFLKPDPSAPALAARRRWEKVENTVNIRGGFMPLFRILDGAEDADALFFSREVRVSGNVEAAVSLRNALDDVTGSVVDDIAEVGGLLAVLVRFVVVHLRASA